ncbi:MAG TPA: sialidase family protein [Candidatus Didemnitutus sp.]|nr:sialidase family protein [Candidatus Didemnitutus sp.]
MKALALLFVVMATTAITPWTSLAQIGTPVFSETAPRGRHLPRLTTSPNGRIVLTFAEKDGTKARYYVAVSDNAGRTFSAPQLIGLAEFGAAILQRQPYVVMDKNNTMHVVMEQPIHNNERALHHQSSTDLGVTWSMPVRISAEPPARPQDFASIAVDENGSIYVSYISVLPSNSDGYTHIFLSRSDDGGLTWSRETRVDSFPVGGCCECCNQNIIIDANGNVVIAFRSNIMNRRDVHLTRSSDGGRTFSTPQLIQSEPWMIDGCPGTGPSVAADTTGTLHVSWRDTRDSRYAGSCYYATVPPNSTATPINVLLNPPLGTDGEYPIVATDPSGMTVAMVYHSYDGVYFTEREMLPGRTTLSTQALANPCVSVVWHGSGFLSIWQEQRGSLSDIVSYRTDVVSSVADSKESGSVPCDAMLYFDLRGRIITHRLPNQVVFGVCTTPHTHQHRSP